MKILLSMIIALSVLAGVAGSASAYDRNDWRSNAFQTGQGV
jgi:hypothetical protein